MTLADVDDSVEDVRTYRSGRRQAGRPVIIFRQPGANIVDTVDGVQALLPQLQAHLPRDEIAYRAGPHHHDSRFGQ